MTQNWGLLQPIGVIHFLAVKYSIVWRAHTFVIPLSRVSWHLISQMDATHVDSFFRSLLGYTGVMWLVVFTCFTILICTSYRSYLGSQWENHGEQKHTKAPTSKKRQVSCSRVLLLFLDVFNACLIFCAHFWITNLFYSFKDFKVVFFWKPLSPW